MLSSGTVGAAAEAWINGVPAIAISAGTNGDWPTWAKWVLTPDALPMWERVAEVAGEIVAAFLEHGFPEGADVISVNIPEDADLNTPRRIVDVARVGYDRLLHPDHAPRWPGDGDRKAGWGYAIGFIKGLMKGL